MAITHQNTVTATNTVSTTCTTGNNNAGANQFYVCAVANRSNKDVTSVTSSDGILTWTQRTEQCAGRAQCRVEVWTAYGNAGGVFTVTATLAASSNAIVVAVSQYDGVDSTTSFEDAQGNNTVGANDTTCTGGTDGTTLTLTTTSTVANAFHYVASCPRNNTSINTPDATYTSRGSNTANVGGELIYLEVYDKSTAGTGADTCTHTITTVRDWAMAGLIIKPTASSGGVLNVTANLRAITTVQGADTGPLIPPGIFNATASLRAITTIQGSNDFISLQGPYNPHPKPENIFDDALESRLLTAQRRTS